METFKAICERMSVREYKNSGIKKEILESLVDAGRRAPSARAVEPWEFVVVTQKHVLAKIAQLAPNGDFIKNAAAAIIIFCRDTKYYLEDGCAATENILLAAADAGLGACWIAGDKKSYAQDMAVLVNAAAELKLVSIISLGWPKDKKEQQKKRSLPQVLHWENF